MLESGPNQVLFGSELMEEEIPVFDKQVGLEAALGDVAVFREALAAFLEDSPATVAALLEAVRVGDLERAQRHAHAVKGAAGTLGARRLQAAALAVEAAIRGGDGSSMLLLADDLAEQFRCFRDQAPGML